MAGRDVPALQLLVVDDDAVPPDRRDYIRLIQRLALELAQERNALRPVELTGLLLAELVELAIGVARIVERRLVGRKVFCNWRFGSSIVAIETSAASSRIAACCAARYRRVSSCSWPTVGRSGATGRSEHADRRIGHRHIATELEAQVLDTGFSSRRASVLDALMSRESPAASGDPAR
jgi:hypothetical protein